MVPIAFRIIPNTIANRTNDVVEIKKNGAILIEDMARSRLMDELNCKGSVNDSRLIFTPVVWANKCDDNKRIIESGNILFANLKLTGQDNSLYYFDKKGSEGHYDKNGKSVQKALMKTPINGARLSSPFGMRKHPIDGFNKMHRGTDFAAPSGTPIMASGSGTVTRARWCGGGGNCIKIKHNSTYETIYAHMKAFAKGIREGKKVKQGQIIGYVGSTGLSTGPHLHYEVIVNGKKVNSQKLKLPSGKTLRGEERKQFELDRIKIDLKLANLR